MPIVKIPLRETPVNPYSRQIATPSNSSRGACDLKTLQTALHARQPWFVTLGLVQVRYGSCRSL
jgi:hypothetical protein